MRILVCGSRTWTDRAAIRDAIEPYVSHDLVVIHGAARGADLLAAEVTQELRNLLGFACRLEPYPADWSRYGPSAGAIRNQQMLDEGKPDLVLAFWDGASRGTEHMVSAATKAGIPVEIVLQERVGS